MHSRVSTFAEFWTAYVDAHQDVRNRRLHFLGTGGAILIAVCAMATRQWLLLIAVPIWGYGCAWIGHFCFERNRPAAFSSPVWAFRGDVRMFVFMLLGWMNRELERVTTTSRDAAGGAASSGTGSAPGGQAPADGMSCGNQPR